MKASEVARVVHKLQRKIHKERCLDDVSIDVNAVRIVVDYKDHRFVYTPDNQLPHLAIVKNLGKKPERVLDFTTTSEDRQSLDYVLDRFVDLAGINAGEPTPRKPVYGDP